MKFENTEVWGFEHSIRGMRNPLESWSKSDSNYCSRINCNDCSKEKNCSSIGSKEFIIGKNDLELMQKLIKAGTPHRKFMRQIFVSVDITAPAYFWAEMDTYKVGVVRNSTSFQHKGMSKEFEVDDFEVEEEIKEILRIKNKIYPDLFYSYETDEFKIYTTESGRKYEIYKNGKIFSLPYSYCDSFGRVRDFPKKEVKPSKTKSGYFELNLGGGKIKERWLLHRLIAEVWLNNPDNYKTVDHKDGNKANNCVENLEWVSIEENVRREWSNFEGFDLQKKYKNWKISSKVSPADKLKIKDLYSQGYSQKELAEKFELSQSQISVICRDLKSNSDNKELFEHCWYWEQILKILNELRGDYLETKDYKYFRLIRQILPMGYLYKSTITMNYENILNMVEYRKNHKLSEWSESFMNWVKSLPYANDLLFL